MLPHYDDRIKGGVKRTFWTHAQAEVKKREIRQEASKAISKKDKPYSRADQKKIASERWGEFCETQRRPGE